MNIFQITKKHYLQYLKLLLALVFIFFNVKLMATHIVGGTMSYRYLSTNANGQIYEITLKVYRDNINGQALLITLQISVYIERMEILWSS